MAFSPAKEVVKQVRPLLSRNHVEAKRRVLNLFKEWCREIEHMNVSYMLPLSYDEAVSKIKSEFLKHKNIKDLRVIDMMILKSEKELFDIKKRYISTYHFYYKFKENETVPKESNEFLKKFISGSN